jgi:hypothetical protein
MLCFFSIYLVLKSSNFESLFILQDYSLRVIALLRIFYMSGTKQGRETRTPFPERNSDPHQLFERFKTVLVCVLHSIAVVIDEVLCKWQSHLAWEIQELH